MHITHHFGKRQPRLLRLSAILVWMILIILGFGACAGQDSKPLIVWTYDSFVSEWGPAAKLSQLFKEKTGLDLEFVSKGDGGALLGVLLSHGKEADADIVVGLDDRLAQRALDSGLFAVMQPSNMENIASTWKVDEKNRLVPFDYGNFALIWDSESDIPPPKSLEDLTLPAYRKKLILMDPRTSTPGLGFLAWTQAIYGAEWKDYWRRLAPSILVMTPGWDTGYGLFTKGEAPLVLSYSTSPAYHKAYEATERYETLVFEQGHTAQIELAGILAQGKRKKDSEKFINFLLSPEAQALLPETQWMYPANSNTSLPESFSVVPPGINTLAAKIENPLADPETAATILVDALK
ncbi:MAG: thiamine transport system substrate-binding protein [Spirochaetes bacterium]|nr:MAG: thiamine transport system substrate-binding protein [Spirochaetota bacterium]